MPDPDDRLDETLKTPGGAKRENPSPRTPSPSEPTNELSPAAPSPAALAERYDLLSELGRGGMGIVYQARDRETGEVVALKVLKPDLANRPEVIERFKAELRLARKVTHKNVCRSHELLRFGDTVAIAMEYVEGESLRGFLERYGSVPLRRGLEWAQQIGNALVEAHAQGVFHRDLKPENILIDRQGQAKVTDFGIARSLETEATATGTVLGTPAYMSPEQAQGKPADARSDIYSLGLILYEMFTGKRGLQAESAVALVLKQIKESPPPPRSVEPYLPSFLDRVIERCLNKDPQKRLQSAAELLAALTEKEVAQPGAAPLELPGHLSHVRRSDLALVVLGILGLIGFIALVPRIIPEAGLRVRLTREMFLERAREEVSRRGWNPPENSWLGPDNDAQVYKFLAQRVGFQEAERQLAQGFPSSLYHVRFREPGASSVSFEGPGVVFEPSGALRSVELPLRGWVPAGGGLSRAESLGLAQKGIRESFGVDPDQLTVENEAPLATEGRHGFSFRWVSRRSTALEWHYQADVYDRLTLLKRWVTLPEDYRPGQDTHYQLIFLTVWTIVAAVLFFSRRVYAQLRGWEAVVLASVGTAGGLGLGTTGPRANPAAFVFFVVVMLSAVFTVWFILMSPTIVHLARRPWPSLAATYSSLLQLRPLPEATGVGLLRGFAFGLVLLTVYSGLLWVASSLRLTWPHLLSPSLGPQITFPFPSLSALSAALAEATVTSFSLGFFLPLIRRWVGSPLALVGAGGLVTLSLSDATLPPDWCQLGLTFLIGVAFSALLLAFDLVTLLGAAATYSLWSRIYPSTLIFESVGNWSYWLLLAAWAGIFAWSVFAAFRPTWSRMGRRLAEAFE